MKKFLLTITIILGICFLLISCSTHAEEVTVTYHTNIEETSIVEKTYEVNHTLNSIDLNLNKDGFELTGWFIDEALSKEVTFPYTLKEDTHFYAKWTKQYHITFMLKNEIYKSITILENQNLLDIPTPSLEGKTFVGWYVDQEFTSLFDFQQNIHEDKILYGKFVDQEFTIAFKDGNITLKEQTIKLNQTISPMEAPSKEGKTFIGWSLKDTIYEPFDFTSKVTSDLLLYAFYEDVLLTITFKVEDKIYDEETIPYNSVVSPLEQEPSKEGYIFKGWYEKDSSTPFDFNTKIKEDIALYAKFEIEKFTITFKDGTQVLETQVVNYNALASAISPNEKTGYEFIGWSLKDNVYESFDWTTKIKQNITLYAYYEILKFNVTYYVNNEIYETQIVNYNSKAKAPTPPKVLGGLFENWCIDNTLTKEFDFNTNILENINLYAKFITVETYTVTFIIGDTIQEIPINENDTITPIEIEVEGYELDKWLVHGTNEVFDFKTPITQDITLTAVLKIKSYSVIFMDDATTIKTQTIIYNQTASTIEAPSKEGHSFLGWSLEKDRFVEFDFNTKIKKETILYAYYEVHEFTIQFIAEGKVFTTQTIKYNSSIIKPTLEPSKTGYKFIGWFTNETDQIAYDFNTKIKEEITLYAKFEILSFTVTFKDGNKIIASQNVTYNQTTSDVTAPSKEGHTFLGWSTKETELELFDWTTKITTNLTLFAIYEADLITVTFKNGTTVFATKEVLYNTTVTPPTEQPTSPEDGKTFVGWFYDDALFDFNTKIIEAIELVAHFEDVQIEITNYKGYNEGLFFEATPLADTQADDYTVNYKLNTSSSWQKVDKELIRISNGKLRCDVVGLIPGSYQVKIDVLGKTQTISCNVTADDRSGYAHFNYDNGVGAYNNDGSLKTNAVVVYVTDSNKNTVKAKIGSKEYTGLANIIKACTNSSYALNIRILGEIQTTQWNFMEHGKGNTTARQENLDETFKYTEDPSGWDTGSSSNYNKLSEKEIIAKGINSMSNDEAKGITKLNGLTNQVLRNKKASSSGAYEYDSYYNMLEVDGGYNITIEGIGTDASIFQWGFTFKKCNSIEVKNLRFYNYTEDAVGFEGSSGKQSSYGNYWVHNCTFDLGVNNWDVCYENDKKDGDGSTDVKYCHSVTISYTQYNKTHKTNLIGSGDSAQQYNITLHHNYYNNCGSRLPLVRQTNIHIYNNYYYKSSSYSHSIRANCFAFVENCYYEGGQNPYEVVKTSTYTGTAIKSYNNIYNGVKLSGSSYKADNNVTSRTETVSGNCKPNGETDYTNFDTNSTLFYYKNNKSDVSVLLSPADVKEFCQTRAGVLKSNPVTGDTGSSGEPTDPETPEVTWQNQTNETFSSSTNITEIEYTTTPPSTPGIYYSYNGSTTDTSANKGSSTNNNVSIKNGELYIYDNSDATTYGYYIFNQTYNTGKVKISIDFTPTTSNGKWTPIHFLDGKSNIGVRSNDSKILGYTTDATNVTTILNSVMTANKTYHIELIVDFDNNTASISIDDTKVTITNYICSQISGIMFQTAGANSRSFSVDNLLVSIAN